MLIRFLGQKVKGQGHNRRMHNSRRQPLEFNLVYVNFTKCPTTFVTVRVNINFLINSNNNNNNNNNYYNRQREDGILCYVGTRKRDAG